MQHIIEQPESSNSEQEKRKEKWAHGDIGGDAKYDTQPLIEVSDADCLGKRAIVTEQEICGTVMYLGKRSADSRLFYGIETVISNFTNERKQSSY